MSIQSLGVGSGLDIRSLVSQLVAAEGQPKIDRYNRKEVDLQAKLSSIGTLKGALSDFQSSLSGLKYSSAFRSIKATSSQTSIFSASATTGAAAGSYTVEVSKLAEAHSVSTKAGTGLNSLSSQIGTGTLTIEFGTWDETGVPPVFSANASKSAKNITITDGSIAGIRDAINKANIGVTANIVYDGTDYRLTMTSETGAANAMRITAADNDGNNTDATGLSMLAFDQDTGSASYAMNVAENNKGIDAEVSIDGLIIKNSSNTLSNIIDNVTIDLKKAEVGTKGTLTVEANTAAVKGGVEKFVESFNTLMNTLDELSFYNADTGEKGVLIGDNAVRNVESTIRRIMGQVFGSVNSAYRSLASIGISTQRDGTLALDSTKLDKALAGNIEDVRLMFAGGYEKPTSSSITYNKLPSGMDSGSIAMNITQAATQGTYVADVLSNLNITAGNNEFVLNVNGVATGSIVLTANTYADGNALATEIQTQLNADSVGKNVLVAYNTSTNKFEFTSKDYGSSSSVTFASALGTLAADSGIGGAAGVSTTGLDIQGTFGGNATQGSYVGAAIGTLNVTTGNNQFMLNVDGQATGNITITANTYADGDALAAEIQTQLNADTVGKNVTVKYNTSSNKLEFYSNNYGGSSSVTVASTVGSLSTDIGIGGVGGVATQGSGLPGTTFAATGSGQTLTGTGDYAGLEIQYNGTSSLYVSPTNKYEGVMKELSNYLDDVLLRDGTIDAKTKSINQQIDEINQGRETLSLRLDSLEMSLIKKFGAMDSMVAQLNGTSTYLAGQFQALANLNKPRA